MLTGRITARFHVLYDPDAGQELEGMTIWDRVDGDGARHQVHVIMVEHDDSLYFKHYEVEPGHVALI
jgi:hypothetical protein